MKNFTSFHSIRRWLALSVWVLCVTGLSAQVRTIRGNISLSDGEPIIGATIRVDNAPERGAVTDISGNFSLNAARGESLRISYTGHTTQVIVLGDEVTGEDIVAIHEADEGAARPIEAHVARRGRPLIALVNHRHPSIPLREVVADPGRGVAGSVVDDNDLEFAIGLCGNAVQALLKIRTHVVDSHDDADQRFG